MSVQGLLGIIFVASAVVILLVVAWQLPNPDRSLSILAAFFCLVLGSLFVLASVGDANTGRAPVNWQIVANWTQTLVVAGALLATVYQVGQAQKAFQAATVAEISGRSDELQWRILRDEALSPLLTGSIKPDPRLERAIAAGMVINHFALLYDLRSLGGLPDQTWHSFEMDLRTTLGTPYFAERWANVKGEHDAGFVAYVDALLVSNVR